MSPLALSQAVVGCGLVSAAVLLGVLFFATGSAVPAALAMLAGATAWWLLREGAP